jgi:hypothetical protein
MKLLEVTMSNCIFEPTDYTSSCKRCGKQKFEHTTILTDKLKKIMNKQTTKEMTLGESRCHINFNPSADDKIGTFKRMMADAIDYCHKLSLESLDPEADRCFEIAMTELETAQMYAIKGIAKGLNK